MLKAVPTSEEIDELLDRCYEQEKKGGSRYPGMTYEQGIIAMFRWLVGDDEESPLGD